MESVNTVGVKVEVDDTELKECVGLLEEAQDLLPSVTFKNCKIENLHVSYTLNNFKEENENE